MALGGYLRSRGVKDGIFGGRRGWLVLGVVMWSGRLVKRLLSRPSELISVERLEPGQSVSISALDPKDGSSAGRSRRRSERRAATDS